VIGLLQADTHATLEVASSTGEDRAWLLARLEKESNGLGREFLRYLNEHRYRLPDAAQETVAGYYVRPDFAYHRADSNTAIFIDGPVHDGGHQAGKDESAQAMLEDEAGWMVLRFHHQDGRTEDCGDHPGWESLIARNPGIFGPSRDTS
jgi:very-short-patch-repair endonuclease